MDSNQIIQGSCEEVLKTFEDNSVDLVLTDPPYGIDVMNWKRQKSRIGYGLSDKIRNYGDVVWDKAPPPKECFTEIIRTSHNQIIFGGNYFDLSPSSCWIVWDKDNGTNDFADAELAWTSFKTAVRIIKWRWNGMLQEPGQKDYRQHPTQKPLGVMKWILERYSQPNDLILDPFCGSGTTCVAAKMLGRRYIGIDISEKYCEIARMRLEAVDTGVPVKEQQKGQMPLFEKG